MTEHSPLPWKRHRPVYYADEAEQIFNDDNILIACYVRPKDAELIVRACNSHADLLEALERLFKQINNDHAYKDTYAMKQAKQAIAKARGPL